MVRGTCRALILGLNYAHFFLYWRQSPQWSSKVLEHCVQRDIKGTDKLLPGVEGMGTG